MNRLERGLVLGARYRLEGRIASGGMGDVWVAKDNVLQRLVALKVMRAEFETTTWQACWEFVVSGRPAAEVAKELGLSVAVVYSAKYRVLRRLRQELEGLLD